MFFIYHIMGFPMSTNVILTATIVALFIIKYSDRKVESTMPFVVKLFFVLVMLVVGRESARILAYFPTPLYSHHLVFRALTRQLVEYGHDVVVITPQPTYAHEETPANLKIIDVQELSFKIISKLALYPKTLTLNGKQSPKIYNSFIKVMWELMEEQFLSEEVQSLFRDKSRRFDLVISEGYISLSMFLGHFYKAPIVYISSLGPLKLNLQMTGSPDNPIYRPVCFQQTVYNHTLRDHLYEYSLSQSLISGDETEPDKIAKRLFGPETPSLSQLQNELDYIFLSNFHHVWDMNRPVASNFVSLGRLHEETKKELPKDLKEYLDSSKTGVVYVSFGTSVDAVTFPPEKLRMLVNMISKLPYDVIWKWNDDNLPGRGSNIRTFKWLPQADLLKHPKVKLFVFQGGLHSTDEAIDAGVPMLCVPTSGDQWYNAQQMMKHGAGWQVDLESATEAGLFNNAHTLIHDKAYRTNVLKLRSILHDQPQAPMTRALWWIHYVLRHRRTKQLTPPSANLHWTQYFEIELLAYSLISALALSVSVVCLVSWAYRLLMRSIWVVRSRLLSVNKL